MKESTVYGDVLLIPLGMEGHLSPFMHLARRILKRGLTCTLLLEEAGAGILEHNFSKYGTLGSSDGFNVRMVESLQGLRITEAVKKWASVCEPAIEELRQYKRDGGKIPAIMIVDQLAGWTHGVANELAIPRYVFCLSAATYAYWLFRFSHLIQKDKVLERVDEDPVLDLPGAPEIRLSEASRSASRVPEIFTAIGDSFGDAAGVLINTFYEVEKNVIDNFHAQLDHSPVGGGGAVRNGLDYSPVGGGVAVRNGLDYSPVGGGGAVRNGWRDIKVLPIGPIPPPPGLPEAAAGDGDVPLGRPEKDSLSLTMVQSVQAGDGAGQGTACIRWLDSRPPGSVVYIAFGSLTSLPEDQVKELAAALEATNVSFCWILLTKAAGNSNAGNQVVESLEQVSHALPPGFQERTGGRGLVHPFFAPQLQILEHPAVGIFLTHCGWNSVLESICRGVPLIGWPRIAEQFLTCKVLEQARVCARISPEYKRESDFLDSGELQRTLRNWPVDGPEVEKLRERTVELQQRAREAVAPGGSSYQNFENFIQRHLPVSSS